MNYIGSKFKLSSFIEETIKKVIGEDLSEKIFCDIFAGTGIVGRKLKTQVKKVISNDLEYYSYVLIRNYIGNHHQFEYKDLIEQLNNLQSQKGFIFEHYCAGGNYNRQYFSDENGMKIDAARKQIEEWKTKGEIDDDQYFFLLCSLLESADKHANTASVYGAFLKHIKKTAAKEMVIVPAIFETSETQSEVYHEDGNELIKRISGDILYLDPPYNARQYGANYHILNTIAKYDDFEPKGKTGLRDYNRSSYCSKRTVLHSFDDLIQNANFNYIFLSYNNEGLMTESEIKTTMQKYGKYHLETKEYQRFKADKTENRNHKADSTLEYLHILEKLT